MNLQGIKARQRHRHQAVAGVLAVAALSAGIVAGAVQATPSRGTAPTCRRAAAHATGPHRTTPRWARKCLPKASDRVAPARGYLGLNLAAAERRDHYRNDLVVDGGGGRCSRADDLVYRLHPIAIVFGHRHARDPRARIIAAAQAMSGWEPEADTNRDWLERDRLAGTQLKAAPPSSSPKRYAAAGLLPRLRSPDRGLTGSGPGDGHAQAGSRPQKQ